MTTCRSLFQKRAHGQEKILNDHLGDITPLAMPDKQQPTIKMPPFPQLVWDDFSWGGIVHLEAWRGFIRLKELCPWISKGILPDGDLDLAVGVPSIHSGKPVPPTREQAVSFEQLLNHQASLRDAVLQAIFADYPNLRECYGDYVEEQAMPEISTPRALMRLIRPSCVHVMAHPKDGFTRVGFGFACSWDEEHGLGVLTHHGVVIAVGEADEAFSEYFTEAELDKERE